MDNWGEMTLPIEVLAAHFFTDDVSARLVGDDETFRNPESASWGSNYPNET